MELADRLQLRQRFDLRAHFGVDQDLAVVRMVKEAGGEIGERSRRGILQTALESDAAERGKAMGDPDPEAKSVTTRAPACGEFCNAVAQRERHLHGVCPWSYPRQRII